MLFHKASLLPKERGFLFSHYEWLRSFLSRLTSLISSLISSRVISGNSPLSAIALISANAAFALAVTSSSSSWAFCGLSFRMVSDVCSLSLSLLTFYFLSANIWQYEGESCRRGNLLIKINL